MAAAAVSFCKKFATVKESEYVRANELEIGVKYKIQKLENCTTKFGECLVGTILTPDEKKSLRVFFPNRYTGLYSSDELDTLKPGEISLVYRGQLGRTSKLELLQ